MTTTKLANQAVFTPSMELQTSQITIKNIIGSITSDLPGFFGSVSAFAKLPFLKGKNYQSIGALLEQQAAATPNAVAILHEDQSLTYDELNRRANQLAHGLKQRQVRSGDAVAIMLENRPECLISVFATVKLGAIAAMINTSQRDDVLIHSFDLVKPACVLVGEELTDNLNTVYDRLDANLKNNIFYISDTGQHPCPEPFRALPSLLENQPDTNLSETAKIQLHQPCYYIFTSGTTGLPKASVMTHLRFFKAMFGMGKASMRIKSDDVLYVCLPLYHNNALTVSLSATLGNGAALAIARKFSVSNFWNDIRHYQATSFCYIGELCRYLLNHPATVDDQNHKIRVIVGNGLRSDIWMQFKQRFNIHRISEFYGASECNLMFVNCFNFDKTCGMCPLSYQIIRYDIDNDQPVRDSRGFTIPVDVGEVGLLVTEVNEKQPFDGYTDSAAGEKKLLHDVFENGDCWFNTGDLVLRQRLRHVEFADRLGDTFRWKGENVATTEVESVMMEHDNVEHAVVYGVEVPRNDGRAGMAAITLKHEMNSEQWSEFSDYLNRCLPSYAVPRFIRLRQQQTVTGTFKYRKVELKKEAFHLNQVDDPLFFFDRSSNGYQSLTGSIEEGINQGEISF